MFPITLKNFGLDERVISIIICSIDAVKFAAISRNYADLLRAEPFEIIGIHDAASLCEGYNRGVAQAKGDILIFSHDDIEILTRDFATRIKRHLEQFDIVGLAGTDLAVDGCWITAGIPYVHGQVSDRDGAVFAVSLYDFGKAASEGKRAVGGMRMLDGLFIAVRRPVLDKLKFDELNFDGFHCYDADFTYSAYLAGFRLAACNDIAVIHYSNKPFSEAFQKYNQRFIEKHAATLQPLPPQAARPSYQVARCANKQDIVHCHVPSLQSDIYKQFSQAYTMPSMEPTRITQTPMHTQHNPDLLGMIPVNAKRIIEVGCGGGALAQAYGKLNTNCDYVGVEVNPEYAKVARQYCRRVVEGDIEAILDDIHASEGVFDCWVFGDVLEHLYDPWYLLKEITRRHLAPGGSVIACIPNMQHWSIQVALNSGELEYQQMGLLDRTHIRWFTRLTVIELFREAGLDIVTLRGRVFDEPGRDAILPHLRALAVAAGHDPEQAVTDAHALQWLIHAKLPGH